MTVIAAPGAPALPSAGPGSLPGAAPVVAPVVTEPGAIAAPAVVAPVVPVDPAAALVIGEAAAPAAVVPSAIVPVAWEPTGQPGLDLALDFIGQRGFGPEHPAVIAAEAGDFSKLEAEMKKLGDKATGYEKYLAAGKAAFEGIAAEAKAGAEKLVAKINTFAGSPEVWAKAREWAGANADPGEKTAINAALKGGGITAFAVAKYLVELYQKQPGTTAEGRPAVQPHAAGSQPGANALSPQEYSREVAALYQKQGTVDGTPEYASLQARRNAWRG